MALLLLLLWFAGLVAWLIQVVRLLFPFWWPVAFRLLWRLSTPPNAQPGSFFRCVAWLMAPSLPCREYGGWFLWRKFLSRREPQRKFVSLRHYVSRLKARLLWQCSPWNPVNFAHALRAKLNSPRTPEALQALAAQADTKWREKLAHFCALHAAGKCPCWKCRFS